MTQRNQDRFDGLSVDEFNGKFSGTFEMDEDKGKEIVIDDVVSFFVVTTADKADIAITKSGDLKRTNTFKIGVVQPLDRELASEIFKKLNIEVPGLDKQDEEFQYTISDFRIDSQSNLDQYDDFVGINDDRYDELKLRYDELKLNDEDVFSPGGDSSIPADPRWGSDEPQAVAIKDPYSKNPDVVAKSALSSWLNEV